MRSTMRHFLKCALLLLVLSTGAWAQTPAKPADKPADKQAEHTLGPGDVIRVSVYQNPDLALEIRNLMVTFEDLLLVDDVGIREILQRVDKKVLTLALKGVPLAPPRLLLT